MIHGDRPFSWPELWFTDRLKQWLPVVTGGSDEEFRWVSRLQLLVDLMLTAGARPPVYRQGQWVNPDAGPAAGMTPWSMGEQVAKQVRCLARYGNVPIQTTETRPDSVAIQEDFGHLDCLSFLATSTR